MNTRVSREGEEGRISIWKKEEDGSPSTYAEVHVEICSPQIRKILRRKATARPFIRAATTGCKLVQESPQSLLQDQGLSL